MSGSARIEAAFESYNAGRMRAALLLFRREARAGDLTARCWAAHCLAALGKPADAVRELRLVLRRDPKHEQAALGLAGLLRRQGRTEEARGFFESAAARGSGQARRALAELAAEAARGAREAPRSAGGAPRKASPAPARAVEAAARAGVLKSRVETLALARRWTAAAGAALLWVRAAAGRPEGLEARLLRGELLMRGGRVTAGRAALRALARSLEDARTEPHRVLRLRALLAAGSFEDAERQGESLLDAGLSRDGAFALSYPWNPAVVDEARRRDGARLGALARAPGAGPWPRFFLCSLDPAGSLATLDGLEKGDAKRYGWMCLRAGWVNLHERRFERACALLARAASSRPFDWRSLGFLAEARACLGRWPDAYAALDEALRRVDASERPAVQAWRGLLLLWQGDYRGALSVLDQAAAAGAVWALGWRAGAQAKLGRFEEALHDAASALERVPRDWDAPFWRAEALLGLGRPREALSACARLPGCAWRALLRASARAALGETDAAARELRALPPEFLAHARAAGAAPEDAGASAARLLESAKGYRRNDGYARVLWLR